MKRFILITASISCLVSAREIRSPLLRDDPGYRLMPLPLSTYTPWDIRAWVEPFGTVAHKALCSTTCNDNASSSCPLSTILFGQPTFTGAEIFSPASVAQSKTIFNGDGTNRTLTCTPLLETSVLKPCLKFIDRGSMFALQVVRRVANCWSAGIRASVPYRRFKITYPCGNKPAFCGATLNNSLCEKQETINGVTVTSYAYRLDILSGLPIGCTYPQNLFPVVDYYNSLHLNNDITISNENVTDNMALPINARNPITLIHQANKPQGQWALPLTTAQTLPALPGNGQTANSRARFVDGTNYQPLGLDTATQAELWVVPSVGTTDLVPAALVIRDNIDELLQTAASTEQFLQNSCCNCLLPQTAKGVGDLQTEYFARWQPNNKVYIESLFGISFPTGKRIKQPQEILLWPTGNNGHYEYRIGVHIGAQPCDYFMINVNSYYTYVANRKELVIASFNGAQVKNIGGPIIPADIHWHYYLGHCDAIFMKPCTKGILGIDIGYEVYDKGHDHIRFKESAVTDCLGNLAQLNPSVLEERTHVVSHKIRTTLFYDRSPYHINDKEIHWSIFAGYSAIVGGINIPKEHGPYGGIMVIY